MMATWWPKHVVINSVPRYNKPFFCCVHDGLHIDPYTFLLGILLFLSVFWAFSMNIALEKMESRYARDFMVNVYDRSTFLLHFVTLCTPNLWVRENICVTKLLTFIGWNKLWRVGQHYGLANSVALSDGLTRYDRWLQDAVAHVRQIKLADNYGCWWYFDTPVRYEYAVGSTKADRAFCVRDCCAFYIARQRRICSIHFLNSETGFALGILQQFCAEFSVGLTGRLW
jgi:hypothetical protein